MSPGWSRTPNTLTGWAYRPDALGICLRHAWDVTGLPLLVTESGIATNDDTLYLKDVPST
ncbi:hypothetical protein [Streptomyces sp. NBC_00063]|uniref:hypothetical protein n=1 Tax=Streptomyces sp. NBC_00063 TaxID=2975638 RepID=UPI003D709F00